jgi:hypothetical protein
MSDPQTTQLDVNAAIQYLEFTGDHRDRLDREWFAKKGVNAEIGLVILARLGANVRIIRNIAILWIVMACLGAIAVLAPRM